MKSSVLYCRSGFTLIELSIVLAIIGLIVGGVLVGKELIHSANLRAILTEQEKLNTAVMVYREKFGQLPGDDPSAQSHLPNCNDPGVSAGNICNGNGDGKISGSHLVDVYEQYHVAWHLSLAGLIPGGSYTGGYGGPPNSVAFPSTVSGGYWWIGHSDDANVIGIYGQSAHFMAIDSPDTENFTPGGTSVLNVPDTYSLDSKIDDGQPGTGSVLALGTDGAGGCLTLPNVPWTQYVMSTTSPVCTPFFRTAF